MKIREATENDVATIVDFQLRMAMETEKVMLNKTVLTAGVVRLLQDSAKGRYYLAVDKEIMGCLMITNEWSDWRDGTVLWIQSVYIPAEFRGQGVYKQLYGHIRQIALETEDVKGIRLYVDRTNQDARNVYQKLGMNGEHYQVYEWMKA